MAKIKICNIKIAVSSMDEFDITDELTSAAKNQILEEYKDVGMEIEIKGITNPEVFVRQYFKNKGYFAVKSSKIWDYIRYSEPGAEELAEKLKELGLDPYSLGTGCPDFVVWNKKGEFFFAEAKSSPSGGLSFNQIRWIQTHLCPVVSIRCCGQ